MTVHLEEILSNLGDLLVGVVGPRNKEIMRATALDRVRADEMTFAKAKDEELLSIAARAEGSAILCSPLGIDVPGEFANTTFVEVTNPRLAFIRTLSRFFAPTRPSPGIHESATVMEGANIHPTASIGAGSFIGSEVVVGANTVIHPNAAIYCPAVIGANVTIHGGAIIGANGFGYERNQDGALESFPHIGGVVIEDDVEIGSNACIDRAALTDTIIRRGAKIDNLCHIAHNVDVGEDVAVIALSMIAGSCKIGDRAWLAPGAMVLNKIDVGVDATVGFGALVVKPVPDSETVMGVPAVSQERFRTMQKALKSLSAA